MATSRDDEFEKSYLATYRGAMLFGSRNMLLERDITRVASLLSLSLFLIAIDNASIDNIPCARVKYFYKVTRKWQSKNGNGKMTMMMMMVG